MTANGTNKYDFVIHPKDDETDKYSVNTSPWRFAVDDGVEPFPGSIEAGSPEWDNTGSGTTFHISAIAIRDPAWKQD